MIIGTFIGGFIDKIGRKLGMFIYGINFFIATISIHYYDSYPIMLIIGRICGGISTALINSIPEAWFTTEITINKKYLPSTLVLCFHIYT